LRAAAEQDAIGVGDEDFAAGAELPGMRPVSQFINAWRFMGCFFMFYLMLCQGQYQTKKKKPYRILR